MRRFLTVLAIAHWLLQALVMALMITIVRPDRMGAEPSEFGRLVSPVAAQQWPLVWAFGGRLFDATSLGAPTANSVLCGLALACLVGLARRVRRQQS